MQRIRWLLPALGMCLVAGLGGLQGVRACPFCSAQSQTFSEEMNSMDAVVIARLQAAPPAPAPGSPATEEVPKAKFEILDVLKGDNLLGAKRVIETIYFGDGKPKLYLIMGVDPPNLMWSTPLPISERGRAYIKQLTSLPSDPAARLEFFQEFLEDSDELLARDAYDEFAKAPYSAVIDLKPKMKHDQLVSWIENPDVPASRRRLYLTMLGVCGTEADIPMLERMLKSEDRKAKSGLDALIACYLTLQGAEGMPLVEELFLKNAKAEYADTYAAIMALRFHGSETDVIPKSRLLVGLRYMLDRPQLADLVIPDLARWEDWSQLDRLVQLFKDADEKSSWVRVPVINYLRACPLPQAKAAMQELEKIDPAAVKRANTFFPFGPPAAPAPPAKTSQSSPPADAHVSQVAAASRSADRLLAEAPAAPTREAAAAVTNSLVPSPHSPLPFASTLNTWQTLAVTWLLGTILMLLQWTLLRGGAVV